MAKKPPVADFDSQLKELEALVQLMERGDLTLDESLAQFEKGIALLRGCEAQLKAAEQKVQILSQQNGGETLADFAPGDQ
jgi:exodeoxyribonuclease VII small subunit